jgi:hypothetical protein
MNKLFKVSIVDDSVSTFYLNVSVINTNIHSFDNDKISDFSDYIQFKINDEKFLFNINDNFTLFGLNRRVKEIWFIRDDDSFNKNFVIFLQNDITVYFEKTN